MLRSIIQMLGLDLSVPDHTTLSRRSARLSLTTALTKHARSHEPAPPNENPLIRPMPALLPLLPKK
jgi:hypothetical protein